MATDGSEETDNALAYATDFGDAMDGSITVVHAVDPAVYEERRSEPVSSLSDANRKLIIENMEDAGSLSTREKGARRGIPTLEDVQTYRTSEDVTE